MVGLQPKKMLCSTAAEAELSLEVKSQMWSGGCFYHSPTEPNTSWEGQFN